MQPRNVTVQLFRNSLFRSNDLDDILQYVKEHYGFELDKVRFYNYFIYRIPAGTKFPEGISLLKVMDEDGEILLNSSISEVDLGINKIWPEKFKAWVKSWFAKS